MQEMVLHLWKKFKNGDFKDATRSYILQSCWYHIKNYLRKIRSRSHTELENLSYDSNFYITETDSDSYNDILDRIDMNIAIFRILNNGITPREKQVLKLLLEGNTLREIGEKIGISFVRVHNIIRNITEKYVHEISVL